ncbi:MAG TPA: diacylglycerol kinase family protein, partial [Candidatus Saccharimonadales bacterium]|nr:diacylglycerol kinase family protein [Candidatus Saccharimonadales bacterium]
MSKQLLVVANPDAGTPLRSVEQLEEALRRLDLHYRLMKVKTPPEADRAVAAVSDGEYQAVAVFGGDGTVIAAMKAAFKKSLPVLILPGGTANVLAKRLGLPRQAETTLELFAEGRYLIRHLHVAVAGGEPFLLDLHFGWLAEANSQAPRQTKRWLGAGAYYLEAARRWRQVQPYNFRLIIDGQEVRQTGYACLIVNEGDLRVLGVPLIPRRQHGRLYVVIVRQIGFWRLLRWYLGRAVTGGNVGGVIAVWSAETATVQEAPDEMMFDDRLVTSALPLPVKSSPHTAMAVIPVQTPHSLTAY